MLIALVSVSAWFVACEPELQLYDELEHGEAVQECEPGALRACYDGAEGTEGVGACTEGVERCASHGRSWLPCEDAVLPTQEICDGETDANCDGVTSCGDTIWSRRFGAETDETIADMATAGDGSVYVVGYYRDPLDLGGGDLSTVDDTRDLFIAKFSSEGDLGYARELYSEDAHSRPRAIAVAPDGSVVAGASVAGVLVADGIDDVSGAGEDDAFVVKLDPDGNIDWWKRWGDDSHQHADDVAFDADGNIIVTGYFRGAVDFGGGSIETSDSHYDGFVVKLAPDGSHLWSRALSGAHDEVPRALAVNPDGTIVVVGYFQGTATFGREDYASAGQRDVFVVKLDADGTTVWSRRFGDAADQRGHDVKVDGQGDIVITGRFEGNMDFGGSVLEVAGGGAMFLVKLAADGEHVWSQRLGGPTDQAGYDLAIDSRDRILLSGYYEVSYSFGNKLLPEGGIDEPNMVLLKVEPNGDPVWARGFVVSGNQDASDAWRAVRFVEVAPNDQLYFAGYVEGPMDFGTGPTDEFGNTDIFITKLEP